MKYQKDFRKVSFGFGNEKVAGKGRLSEQHTPREKNVDDRTALITVILQVLIGGAAIAARLILGKKSIAKKNRKKERKAAKKAEKLAKKAKKGK